MTAAAKLARSFADSLRPGPSGDPEIIWQLGSSFAVRGSVDPTVYKVTVEEWPATPCSFSCEHSEQWLCEFCGKRVEGTLSVADTCELLTSATGDSTQADATQKADAEASRPRKPMDGQAS